MAGGHALGTALRISYVPLTALVSPTSPCYSTVNAKGTVRVGPLPLSDGDPGAAPLLPPDGGDEGLVPRQPPPGSSARIERRRLREPGLEPLPVV